MKTRPAKKLRHTRPKKCRAAKVTRRQQRRQRRRRRAVPRSLRRLFPVARKSRPRAAEKNLPSFTSLDFPGRDALSPQEIAERLNCSPDHIYDLILEGQLHALDIAGRNNGSARRSIRIPIESWRKFLNDRTV